MIEDRVPEIVEIDGWHFRVQYPEQTSAHSRIMLLLHGYQGNENVMWILTKPLPRDYVLIAPRAPINTGEDQYVWHEIAPQWPNLQTYQTLVDELILRLDHWRVENGLETTQFDLMGFSQGAVVSYALACLRPERVQRVAALAGFIPHAWHSQVDTTAVQNKSFFIAHGTQDDIIPIRKAYEAARWLEEIGAQVTLCTADIGHKLSSNCYSGLGDFFN